MHLSGIGTILEILVRDVFKIGIELASVRNKLRNMHVSAVKKKSF